MKGSNVSYAPDNARYKAMKYVPCGTSGLKLPALSLGGWHNFSDPKQARELVLGSFDLGVTHIDLANNYGPPPGSAEKSFGKILREDLGAHRDELVISTKAGYGMWQGPYGDGGSRKYLLSSLDQSLQRMRLDTVDIFYHHRPDPETPMEETIGALEQAVRSGKALYVGISNYSANQTIRAHRIAKDLGISLLINQINYSMLNRWVEKDLLVEEKRLGMGVIAFCPLAQGLLTDRYLQGTAPEDSRAAGQSQFLGKDSLKPELVKKLNNLNNFAKNRGQSLAGMALSWVLRDGKVTSVLIGASRIEQVKANVKELQEAEPFSASELDKIDVILKT